jgi:hypothetical protein
MGFLSDLFSSKQSTTSQQSGTQSGGTQNNLLPQIQPYAAQVTNQFSPGNIATTGMPNAYQGQAGANQASVPGQLAPAYAAAGNIAATGINPASIAAFQSPYQQQVVDATQRDFATQNARDYASSNANAARVGALTGSGSQVARNLANESQQRVQAPIIANLRNQGFNTAAGLAGQSAGLQLAGATGLGSLTSAATGANQGLYNIGQGLYQTGLTPYSLTQQGAQSLGALAGSAGSTYQGTTSGTSQGTGTATPSLGSILSGLAGTAMSFFHDGGRVGYAEGGMPAPFHGGDLGDKVAKAFRTFKAIKDEHRPRYDWGGSVSPMGSWDASVSPGLGGPASADPYWDSVKATAEANPSGGGPSLMNKVGSSLSGFSKEMGGTSAPNMGDAISRQQDALSRTLAGMPRGFDDGGAVWDHDGQPVFNEPYGGDAGPSFAGASTPSTPAPKAASTPSVPAPTSGASSFWDRLPKPSLGGIYAGEKATPWQRVGMGLMQVGNGPFAGYGQALQHAQEQRLKEMAAEREAGALLGKFQGQPTLAARGLEQAAGIATGRIDGKPTLEAQKLPYEIEAFKARSIPGQIEVKTTEQKFAKELAIQKSLLDQETEINKSVTYGVITPQEGEHLRQKARAAYQQAKENLQTTGHPVTPAQTPPPNTAGTWTPDKGFVPAGTQ